MTHGNGYVGRRVPAVLSGVAAGLWILAAGTVGVAGQDAAKSVNEGVYTAAQAQRGGAIFEANCTTCHDTGRFTGPDFVSTWSGQPLHTLFDTVSTTMPEDNPGSLKPQQYGDLIAFFLKLNEYPEGAEDLKGEAAAMKAVKMEPKK